MILAMRIGSIWLLILTAAALLLASCGRSEDTATATPSPTAEAPVPVPMVRDSSTGRIPTFTMSAYQGEEILGGSTGIEVSQLIGGGRPAVLYFWHAECDPCRNMLLILQQFYEAHQSQVLVVGVDVGPLIGKEEGSAYVRDQQITFPVGTVDDGNATLMGYFMSFPATLFISDEGKLVRGGVGFLPLKRLLAFASEMSQDIRIVDLAPTGPGERFQDQGQDHIGFGEGHPIYSSTPATSGWHYSGRLAPVDWGLHEVVLPDEVLVHNLEHGGIGVHYDCPQGCVELVAQLGEIITRARDEGNKVIMSPYPGMDTRIALTAWTFMDRFDEFDQDRITKFISAHESSLNAPQASAR